MSNQSRALSKLDFNVSEMIYDVTKSFNPLSKDRIFDFEVTDSRDGYVVLSLALPEGMTRVFLTMLESMAGMFKFMDFKIKAVAAQKKAVDPVLKGIERDRMKTLQDKFTTDCCKLFDKFILQGHDKIKAVQLTNLALKAKEHPWASTDVVRKAITSTGRFRKNWQGVSCPS